jgi:pimeloyl-ACP methyl ester carboxylesterase
MTEPREIRLDLDRISLSALTWGPDDGPLAVLLHGFPDTAWTWRHLGPELAAEGWRVVAPFTRGYAPSQVPEDGCFVIGALVSDAVGVHRACDGDERSVLIGHDWGGITANAVGAHPDSPFARIVSMAVPPFPAYRTLRVLPGIPAQALRTSYVGFNQLPLLPERILPRLIPRIWRAWAPGYDASLDLERVAEATSGVANRGAVLAYYRRLVRPGRVPEPYRRWHRTWDGAPTVPTLYLHGEGDRCMSVRFARLVDAVLPPGSRTVIVPDAGHFLQLEQPRLVNDAVLRFLRDV